MRFLRLLLAVWVLGVLAHAPTIAEEAQAPVKIEKRQLLVPRKGESAEPAAFTEDPMQWVREKQQSVYGSLAKTLRDIKTGSALWAAWTLVLVSFGYGVLHAAGPGHGKAVISAWLLATENELKRGVLVAFLSSIVQALTAVAVVSAVLFIFSGAIQATRNAASLLESVSYALIGGLGLYLIWTAVRRKPAALPAPIQDAPRFELVSRPQAGAGHVHGPDCGCGHAHAPSPADVAKDWSLGRAVSMSVAIGIRPCTGALLVLLAAYPLGLYWAGVLSSFAMAAGTFITVSVIAAVTVYAKQWAQRLAGEERAWIRWAEFSVRLGAGLLVTILGATLFWASLGRGLLPA